MGAPKLAKLMSIRELAIAQGIPRSTLQDRIDRLEAEGPCPWIVRPRKRGQAVGINVEMMREHRPELFEPVTLGEQVEENSEQITAMGEVLRGHEMRLRLLEARNSGRS